MNAHLAQLPLWADALVAALLVTGAAFALIGGVALVKLSDFYKRLHGPTKATTLGVGGVLLASALYFSVRGPVVSLHELMITRVRVPDGAGQRAHAGEGGAVPRAPRRPTFPLSCAGSRRAPDSCDRVPGASSSRLRCGINGFRLGTQPVVPPSPSG